MTFENVRDFVLKLLNRYTVAGTSVAPSYNCQADYLARIPQLVNDAMMEIATTTFKIPAILEIDSSDAEDYGSNYIRYKLPEDMFEIKSGGVMHKGSHQIVKPNTEYRLQGREYILLPRDLGGTFVIEYYRYPKMLPGKPKGDEILDNAPVTHMAIPYYVAAFLVDQDDAFLFATFYNKYEDKLEKMAPSIQAEFQEINDVYDGVFTGGDS